MTNTINDVGGIDTRTDETHYSYRTKLEDKLSRIEKVCEHYKTDIYCNPLLQEILTVINNEDIYRRG